MTYQLGIVAHPARAGQAIQLRQHVNANVTSFDHDAIGATANHARVLHALQDAPQWAVILEDDAIPCHHFDAALTAYLNDATGDIVSLYLGTGRWAGTVPHVHEPKVAALIAEADATNATWITTNALWHAVGYAIRSTRIPSLLDHLAAARSPIDQAITAWAKGLRLQVLYTWPSLVDHRDQERLVAGPERHVPRHAWRLYASEQAMP